MIFSQESLITPEEILADVLLQAGDEDYRMFTKGWYLSQIQQCLEELSFDTFLLELFDDFEFPADTYALRLPENTFNVRNIYVYNGEIGQPTDANMVRWKKGYKTYGVNRSYTSDHKPDQTEDPFILAISSSTEGELLFASIENGVVTFSSTCAIYSYIRLIYNGTLIPIGESPFVPQIFRQVVKDWVMLQYYAVMKNRQPRKYRILWNDTYAVLYKPFTGSWDKANARVKSMDTKIISDLKEYLSMMNTNE